MVLGAFGGRRGIPFRPLSGAYKAPDLVSGRFVKDVILTPEGYKQLTASSAAANDRRRSSGRIGCSRVRRDRGERRVRRHEEQADDAPGTHRSSERLERPGHRQEAGGHERRLGRRGRPPPRRRREGRRSASSSDPRRRTRPERKLSGESPWARRSWAGRADRQVVTPRGSRSNSRSWRSGGVAGASAGADTQVCPSTPILCSSPLPSRLAPVAYRRGLYSSPHTAGASSRAGRSTSAPSRLPSRASRPASASPTMRCRHPDRPAARNVVDIEERGPAYSTFGFVRRATCLSPRTGVFSISPSTLATASSRGRADDWSRGRVGTLATRFVARSSPTPGRAGSRDAVGSPLSACSPPRLCVRLCSSLRAWELGAGAVVVVGAIALLGWIGTGPTAGAPRGWRRRRAGARGRGGWRGRRRSGGLGRVRRGGHGAHPPPAHVR